MKKLLSCNMILILFMIMLLSPLQNSSAESNVFKCLAAPWSSDKQSWFDVKGKEGVLVVDGYKEFSYCHWQITVPDGKRIRLTFESFSVGEIQYERPYKCKDNVQIWDGPDQFTSRDLGSYCGHAVPAPVYSTGSSMMVKFSANNELVSLLPKFGGSGFKARFEALEKDPADMQIKVLCLASNSDTVNKNLHMNGTSGRFQSPNYPLLYPSPITCVWKIVVPSGKRIKLSFESFYIGEGSGKYCPSDNDGDFLEAKDDRGSSKTFCGRKMPPAYYSSGNHMEVKFHCFYNTGWSTGFRARYQAVDKEPLNIAMIAGLTAGAVVFVIAVIVTLYYIKRFYWSQVRSFLFGTAHADVSAAFPSIFPSAAGQTEFHAERHFQAPSGYPQQPSIPDQPETIVFRGDNDMTALKEHFYS